MVRTSYHTDSWLSCKHPSPPFSLLISVFTYRQKHYWYKNFVQCIIQHVSCLPVLKYHITSSVLWGVNFRVFFSWKTWELLRKSFLWWRKSDLIHVTYLQYGTMPEDGVLYFRIGVMQCFFSPRYFPLSFYSLYLFNPPHMHTCIRV